MSLNLVIREMYKNRGAIFKCEYKKYLYKMKMALTILR